MLDLSNSCICNLVKEGAQHEICFIYLSVSFAKNDIKKKYLVLSYDLENMVR